MSARATCEGIEVPPFGELAARHVSKVWAAKRLAQSNFNLY